MKSPFPATSQNNLKPLTNTTFTTTTTTATTHNYEPTSVLDLRRSPSPVPGGGGGGSETGFTAISSVCDDSPLLHWEQQQQGLHHPPPPPTPLLASEDWDSMIWDLGGFHKDDSTQKNSNIPQFQTPSFEPSKNPNHFQPFDADFTDFNTFNHLQTTNFNPTTTTNNEFNPLQSDGGVVVDNSNHLEFDCSQLEQLIRASASIESNELQLAQVILARLNQSLQSPIGKPLQRSAFYFKEALQIHLTGSDSTPIHHSPSEIVQRIRAYKSFSEISPIPLFANFTANQSLLEASDGAMFIHIVDFDIGLGGQWASYMQAIASKAKSRGISPASLRITGVIPEEYSMEANLIKENLQQFARELGIRFQLEFVHFRAFEALLFNTIRFINGEMIAVNLSPAIFRQLGTSETVSSFLRFLRRISPQITMFVDNECCKDSGTSSFRRSFVNGLEFYSAMLESLDAANSGDVSAVGRIERFLLRPKIVGAVAAARNGVMPWRELLLGAGMVPVPLSEFTESQADWLVRRSHIRGFHVAKRQGALLLCWHERELVATSAWMC